MKTTSRKKRAKMSDGLGPKKSVSFPMDVHQIILNRMHITSQTYVQVVRGIVVGAIRKPFE